ncbi:hypothetical protein ACH5RR_017933 [Cinchona calisaya]|uniref:SBP-type domain-containing protein n=1 Tax=Cinchona calisaya TaxID=153742 RepID=A0ABD2ZKY3_9GENT
MTHQYGWEVEDCTADMKDAKPYHRRHRVCEHHSKASIVLVAGMRQRFCQQCSRFHDLSEFDEAKRSCRRRLAGHNERRRKSSNDYHGEGEMGAGSGVQWWKGASGKEREAFRRRVWGYFHG